MPNERERVALLWAEYEPRIAAAKQRHADKATVDFVDLHEEQIGDLPAVVLTVERYLLLEQAGVFDDTCGDAVNPILLFLWIVHPDFEATPKAGRKFFRKHRRLNFEQYGYRVEAYVGRMFGASKNEQRESRSTKASRGTSSRGAWVASIVDLIASEYGWQEIDILRAPIPRLLRYANQIRIRHGGTAVEFSEEADKLQAEFMAKANEGTARG